MLVTVEVARDAVQAWHGASGNGVKPILRLARHVGDYAGLDVVLQVLEISAVDAYDNDRGIVP